MTFTEYATKIDTSRIKTMYDKADIAIQIAQEWDAQKNDPPLFANVNAVVNLDGRNYGLFSSSMGKDDHQMVLLNRKQAKNFPTQDIAQKYPQVTMGYPVMVNIRLILKNSKSEVEAVKTIGGVAVHEATHAQDFTTQLANRNDHKPSLAEQRPEGMRAAFEAWFDQNVRSLQARFPALRK